MALTHEIPTHLNVEDKPLLGLTMRHFMELMAGLAGTYSLWNQWPQLPLGGRLTLTALSLAMTLACSFLRPGGLNVEKWALIGLEYALTPRRRLWRPAEPDPAEWWPRPSRWEELTPRLAWPGSDVAVAGAVHAEARP
jgi:hypothetical protein